MIETRDLSFAYNVKKQFSFPDIKCADGESCLILGNSGKGKTTFLHLLGLLQAPASGHIIINNTSLENLNGKQQSAFRANQIGIIFQKNHFIRSLNVLDNILISPYFANKEKGLQKAHEWSEMLGISELLNKMTFEISGGEQQRVGIVRSLMNDPAVILADEPTSNLDDLNSERVLNLLQNSAKKLNASLIIVSHDQRLKNKISNQIQL